MSKMTIEFRRLNPLAGRYSMGAVAEGNACVRRNDAPSRVAGELA